MEIHIGRRELIAALGGAAARTPSGGQLRLSAGAQPDYPEALINRGDALRDRFKAALG